MKNCANIKRLRKDMKGNIRAGGVRITIKENAGSKKLFEKNVRV